MEILKYLNWITTKILFWNLHNGADVTGNDFTFFNAFLKYKHLNQWIAHKIKKLEKGNPMRKKTMIKMRIDINNIKSQPKE